jgi:transcriptional regulator with XRE-family HTH domain
MTGVAARIRQLREQRGSTQSEAARLLGLSAMEYFDLELYDDELESVPSLATVKRIAEYLGVPAVGLFPNSSSTEATPMPYAELVARAQEYMRSTGLTRAELEAAVGWDLANFFAGEAAMLANYPIDFLKHLCEPLGVPWLRALA